ncbi:endolytic transglycosylase MltG [Vagococcus vulneris]|uniref:Endolytic murein transglycosylase n=1 Tax=Vagococcus vulneris TaxID=1977869 RepID=A0A430A016_9ENTE|nr:aminodeoxychorismate lyase [Vagococcus vulneris]
MSESGSSDKTQPKRNRTRQKKYNKKQKENKTVGRIIAIVITLLVMAIVIAAFSFYSFFKSSLKPLNPDNKKLVQVNIPVGSSSKEIGQILEKDKVIKSGLVFSYYVKMNNLSDFQAGYYQMAPSMELSEIAKTLQQGGTDEPEALADAKLTVPEGYSVNQIADLLGKKTKIKKDDFMNLMKNEDYFNGLVEKYPELLTSDKDSKGVKYHLEGYLYPATYNYYEDTKLEDLVDQMVAKSNQVMLPYYEQIKTKNLTVQEVLTLASLVEKEGVHELDRRKIAQVFFNRINAGMPLQSDISILYALDEHKVHLSNADTQVDSPYNLYLNKGYGPGPFNNPSQQAIEAVLNPEPNDFMYFLADVSTGKVYYAKNYEEHLKLKEEYIDNKK